MKAGFGSEYCCKNVSMKNKCCVNVKVYVEIICVCVVHVRIRPYLPFPLAPLNPVLKTGIHSLPIPEELFHKLNQGCKFSKIDLADTY